MKNTSLAIYDNKEKCLKRIEDIGDQIISARSTYDLVRMEDIEIATRSNKMVVAQMLISLNKFLNVSRPMNEHQIIETVNLMLSQYPNMSLQEYQYFFNQIKIGKYGHLYESIDGIKIMAFLDQFYKELNRSYNEYEIEKDYQRKVECGCRDIDYWQGR